MRLTSTDKQASYFKVIDLDTGKEINHCTYANEETGEYTVISTDRDGRIVMEDLINDEWVSRKESKEKGYIKDSWQQVNPVTGKYWIENSRLATEVRKGNIKLVMTV